jgi:hypothetical protein
MPSLFFCNTLMEPRKTSHYDVTKAVGASLVGILRSIVAPSTALMAFSDSKMTDCSPMKCPVICRDFVGDEAIFRQAFAPI